MLPDPDKILDLPKGFSYRIISRKGERMNDGFFVPEDHDGMAAFPGPDGLTVLVRNHEINVGGNAGDGPFGRNNELLARLEALQAIDRNQRHESRTKELNHV